MSWTGSPNLLEEIVGFSASYHVSVGDFAFANGHFD